MDRMAVPLTKRGNFSVIACMRVFAKMYAGNVYIEAAMYLMECAPRNFLMATWAVVPRFVDWRQEYTQRNSVP